MYLPNRMLSFVSYDVYYLLLNIKWYVKNIFLSFSAPDFVNSISEGDYVFFFFREKAVEYINCGKVSLGTQLQFLVIIKHTYEFDDD